MARKPLPPADQYRLFLETLEDRIAPAVISVLPVSSLNGGNGFAANGAGELNSAGSSVQNAGDLNADGFDDVIIAAVNIGSSYVLFGDVGGFNASMNLSTLDGTDGFRIDGLEGSGINGFPVTGAGDVNGDGIDDIIIGSPNADPNAMAYAGSSYVIFGKASGFAAAMHVSQLDGTNGFRIDGAAAYDQSGFSVSGAGDVNGDGFDDVIIGANNAGPNGLLSGASYVVFGKDTPFGSSLALSSLDGMNGFRLEGVAADDQAGWSVGGAGDLNDDGYDDVVIGATNQVSIINPDNGNAYVVFGKATGFTVTQNLSALNGTNGFHITSVVAGNMGYAVSGAGDINADGISDLIIGAPQTKDISLVKTGASYVVFGSDAGFASELAVSTLDGTNGFRINATLGEYSGNSVSHAGDVNGDGFDDLIIGAYNSLSGTGSSYVVFGKDKAFGALLNLSTLDGHNGFRINGVSEFGSAGWSVGGGGDFNGDGYADVIVGAPGVEFSEGAAYTIFGAPDNNFYFSKYNKTLTFTDENGDLVTVKSSVAMSLANFRFHNVGYGAELTELKFLDPKYQGAKITVTAKPFFRIGDGLANVGYLNATGVDLDTVSIKGDLGRIDAGDTSATTAAVKTLTVSTMGAQPHTGILNSDLAGGAGKIVAGGDLTDVAIRAIGNGAIIGSITTKGSLIGTTISIAGLSNPITTKAATALGSLTVGGSVFDSNIIVGAEANPDVQIGKVSVSGNWVASSLVAGAEMGWMGQWGTVSNALADTIPSNAIPSHIGSIIIKGSVAGTGIIGDSFGFVSEQVASLKIGKGTVICGDMMRLTGDGEVRLRLIGVAAVALTGPIQTSSAPSVIPLNTLDGTNGFAINGMSSGDRSGASVHSVGDVNGDGFDDVIVGAYKANGNAGASYVVFGDAGGFTTPFQLASLDGTNGFRLDGTNGNDRSGLSVSSAGDVNGDGIADLIVGAPGFNSFTGASYVVFGKTDWSATSVLALSSLDGTNGFRIDGVATADQSAISVSGAGDVDGDGYDDLIIGAQGVNGYSGASYVVFGNGDWSTTPVLALSSLDGTNGFLMNGAGATARLGAAVSGAGDINGDGFADVMIGAQQASTNGSNSGATYVVFGKGSAFAATLNLSALDGTTGFRVDGASAGDKSGNAVSGAGDVNGDGFSDIIIGSRVAGGLAGSSYVVFGKGSGFGSSLGLSTLNGSNGFRIDGASAYEQSGFAVGSAGDMNGDGFADLIIGAPVGSPNGDLLAGSSYVVFGQGTGFGATLALSGLNGANGFRIDGAAAYGYSGWSVSEAGDLNGDGFQDIIIGAPKVSPNGGASGQSYVIFGAPTAIDAVVAAGGKSATYTDENGDLVTVKIGAGALTQDSLHLVKSGFGAKLLTLDLNDAQFNGASVAISAKPTKGLGGDGRANIGVIDAGSSANLGVVNIAGDLGRIIAGKASNAGTTIQAVKSLSVNSIGIDPYSSNNSFFAGSVGKFSVTTDIFDAGLSAQGNGARFDAITTKGSLREVLISAQGFANPSSAMDAVAIKSLAVGGSVNDSTIIVGAELNAQTQIGKVAVNGTWTESNLVAGAVKGVDLQWGKPSNALAGNTGGIASRIASILIKGAIFGGNDPLESFGFVAHQFGSIKIGTGSVSIFNNTQLAPASGDVTLRLV